MSEQAVDGRLKVLVVEDLIDFRRLLRLSLSEEGCEVYEAGTGDEALAAAGAVMPDVVVLDVTLPGSLHGYEVCRRLRSDASQAGIKIILLTARSQAADLESGRRAGADFYLTKPFSPRRLAELVHRCGPRRADDPSRVLDSAAAVEGWTGAFDLRSLRATLGDG